jgi:FMN phosphatase YigB (HAD superfamily)
MVPSFPTVFLIDVDNTLLDNDRIQEDLRDHLERFYGRDACDRYWTILDDLFAELGYRDYLGALQRFRAEHPLDVELLWMSAFFIDYPFAARVYPSSFDVLKRLGAAGLPVILSDGDVVFQPHKIERSGLSDAVGGRALVYIHKEKALDDVERRFPAERYVVIDDKLRILQAIKRSWKDRVTTIFVRQGSYAHDPNAIGAFPPADVTVENIGDLLHLDPSRWQPIDCTQVRILEGA